MFSLTVFGDVLVGVGGYVASIYTWPYVRTFLVSAESDLAAAKAKVAALEAAVTTKPSS